MRRRRICPLVSLLTAVLVLVPGVGTATAGASTSSQTQDLQQCPELVVLVARGNNDAGGDFAPRRYGGPTGRQSNGHESQRVGDFLEFIEQRYRDTHDGEWLLADVQVYGLSEQFYPADIPIPEIKDDSDVLTLLSSAGDLTQDVVSGIRRMVTVGAAGARAGIEDYEQRTGCAPHYLLFGYSMGTMVLAPQERWLAERGRLAGAVYVASPFQVGGHSPVAGVSSTSTGLLGHLPPPLRPEAGTANRAYYCLPDDPVCDPSPRALDRALAEDEGGPHAHYFRDLTGPGVAALADTMGGWIDRTRH